MVIKIGFVAAVVICCVFTPVYLVEQRKKISVVSLTYKMICATAFVAAGILAARIADNSSAFASEMIKGLVFSWFGDFFLHLAPKNKKIKLACFAVGVISFLTAHIFYILAYGEAFCAYFPREKRFLPVFGYIAIALILAAYVVVVRLIGMKLKIVMLPLLVYGIVLSLMLVKSVWFSFCIVTSCGAALIPGAVLASLGAVCFALSDMSLGVLIFSSEHKKNFPLKIFNIVTYFGAQLMLASTIFFFTGA